MRPPIDPTSPVPLYFQLKQLLMEKISGGELKPGDQVPTESELCESYGMSRTPVRQALLELSKEGLVRRQAGRGTFVTGPSPQSVTLRVMVPDERWQGPLEEAASRLNGSRDGPRLELDVTAVPLAELHDRLLLSVARGQAPDISVVDTVWVAELAHRRYLYPLDELDPSWTQELRSSFFEPLVDACQYERVLHAVPVNADATVLWYRRDWLTAEGLEAPTSWPELLAVGRHFRLPAVRRRYPSLDFPLSFVGGRAGGETTTYQLLPLLWAAGGDLVDSGRIVLDSEPNRRALGFLRELVRREELASASVVGLPWDGAVRELAAGRAALAFGGTYEHFLIQSAAGLDPGTFASRFGFAPLPAGPARGRAPTIVGSMAYAITHQSRRPQEALELLRIALSSEVLGQLSVATSQNVAHLGVKTAPDSPVASFLEQAAVHIAGARSRPALPAFDRVSAQFQELVELCIVGDAPITEILRRTAERMSGITGLPTADTSQAA